MNKASLAIAEAVSLEGGRTFFVGGAVRDSLLGIKPQDFDLEVFDLPLERLQAILSDFGTLHLVGKQFAVFHLTVDGAVLQVSVPRLERKTAPGHKGFVVEANPNLTPKEASRRRDFTVNSLMQDVVTGEILDYWDGRGDLDRGLLRHVSKAFSEDPLRVLRAARFVSRFGWKISSDTADLCRGLDLSELPRERLEGEWKQILLAGKFPGSGLLALELVGALRFFPEIEALRGVPQDPIWHPEGDVLHHTALCLNQAVKIRSKMEDPWVEMLAVLCHDLGKSRETEFSKSRWRSIAHDAAGVSLTRIFLNRITAQEDVMSQVVSLVREHLKPSQLWAARENVSDAAIRRLALRVNIPALVRVAWSDSAGRAYPQPQLEKWEPAEWLLGRAITLGVDGKVPQPFLSGRDLLQLGVKQGPRVGDILGRSFELQLDGFFRDRSEALSWVAKEVARRD